MRHNQRVTDCLAEWAVATAWDALPAKVTHQAKRSLMNFFAVALTGCRDATIETALASLAAFSAGGQATVIGRRERLDALSAAFINATGANGQAVTVSTQVQGVVSAVNTSANPPTLTVGGQTVPMSSIQSINSGGGSGLASGLSSSLSSLNSNIGSLNNAINSLSQLL